MRKLLIILGIPIDDLNMEQTLDRLEAFVEDGRATGRSHQVVTINADFVVKALYDPELRFILQEANLATADGMPLVWGARLLGVPLEGRVAGADLVPALAERAAHKGYSLYLLGAAPGIAAKAADILRRRFPGLNIAGVQSPPYQPLLDMEPEILEDIRKARPDILLVAFGNPKQEKFISLYRQQLNVPVMIGVGGTLDFITGNTRRAPVWMQRVGLEWLHRMLQEPRRLIRRYVVDLVVFTAFFVRQWWHMRQGQTPSTIVPISDLALIEDTVVLSICGNVNIDNYHIFRHTAQQGLAISPYMILNLARLEFMDSSAIGTLVDLTRQAREAGGELVLVAVPELVMEVFSLLRLDRFFVILEDIDAGLAAQRHKARPDIVADKATMHPQAGSQTNPTWAVLKAPRRLDAKTATNFTLSGWETLGTNPRMIVDFSETVYLASAGLLALRKLAQDAEKLNGTLRMAHCSPDVLKVVQLARFDRLLAIYPDIQSASLPHPNEMKQRNLSRESHPVSNW